MLQNIQGHTKNKKQINVISAKQTDRQTGRQAGTHTHTHTQLFSALPCCGLPCSALPCPALPCSALLCYSLLWLVGPHVWVPKLASEAIVVCFVVTLGYIWASSQQVGSESRVNMEFSQQAGYAMQFSHLLGCWCMWWGVWW